MARSHYQAPKQAFSGARFDALTAAVRYLYGRVCIYRKSSLTHEDLLNLFIRPKDHQACLDAVKLFGGAGGTFQTWVPVPEQDNKVYIEMTQLLSKTHKGFVVPKYAGEFFN